MIKMFFHNLKYMLKILFKNKMLIFWTFAFPIILGTLFNLAFSNIADSEKMDIISIAIVKDEEFQKNIYFKMAFQELSSKTNKDRLFYTKYVSEKKAKELLENDEIVGYLKMKNGEPQITIVNNGIDETVFKYVTDQIFQMSKTGILEMEKIHIKDVSNKNLDYTMIEFYTLIAMTALYGGIFSIWIINQIMPNLSARGKRIAIAPIKKESLLFSSFLASYIVQLIGMLILFVYTIFVIHVDYGIHSELVVLLALIGSLAGLSIGLAIGVLLKVSENSKTGILIAITMLGCYLAGMMGISMKNIVDKGAPFVNKINPAAIITDGFYSLYYYETLERYWMDITSLLIISVILILASFRGLRRQRYDSI